MENISSKVNILKDIMEKYGTDFEKVYEHNCKFKIINIDDSKDLTEIEKKQIKQRVKELEYYYKFVVDKKYILVTSKKYNKKIITVILKLRYLEKEISCCVDYLFNYKKKYLKEMETLVANTENIVILQEEKDKIIKYDIEIHGKNTSTKESKSRLYSYDRIKIEETDDDMLLVERFINKDGLLTTRNMINDYEWIITLEEAEELEKKDEKITEDEMAEYIYTQSKENIN